MQRWALMILLLPVLLCALPSPEPLPPAQVWLELERGLELGDVENITYQGYCFISEDEQERILSAGMDPLAIDPGCPPGCAWSMQGGCENGEILLRIGGADRAACGKLWSRLRGMIGPGGGAAARIWSVEAYRDDADDLTALGRALISALGGRLQQINTGPGMVQMLAHLPWAGEGILLEGDPVNLDLELYRNTYLGKIRIRLGIPVLLSLPNAPEEGTTPWNNS